VSRYLENDSARAQIDDLAEKLHGDRTAMFLGLAAQEPDSPDMARTVAQADPP
jgi:hypothetical protein